MERMSGNEARDAYRAWDLSIRGVIMPATSCGVRSGDIEESRLSIFSFW
jgi:hypothetical protein